MEGSRLIIPHKSRKHHYRMLLGVAVGTLAVVAVWGFQMKMTFSSFAVREEDQVWQQTLSGFNEAANLNRATKEAEQAEMEALILEAVQKEQSKNEVLDKVAETINAELNAPSDSSMAEGAAVGTVAGATIEAN